MLLSAPKGNVWIVTDRSSYDLQRLTSGARIVTVTAGVEDPHGMPMPEAKLTATLTRPDKGREVLDLTAARGDLMRKTVLRGRPVRLPGVYTLKVAATVAGKSLTAEHKFEVVRHDLEKDEVLANTALLKQMAQASGGTYVPLAKMGSLLAKLRIESRPKPVDVVDRKSMGQFLRWPIVLALIVLLCLEWALRKRKGLV